MESSSSQNSKKRVFPGSSSSSSAEPDVIEIDPPAHQYPKTKATGTQKEVAFHEIIDLDIDENIVFLGGNNVDSNKKMKGIMGISIGSSNASKLDAKKVESNNKGKEVLDYSKSLNTKSTNFFDFDDYVSDDVNDLTLQSHYSQVTINSLSPSTSALAESSSSKAKPRRSSSNAKPPIIDDAMEKYKGLKKFDTAMDHSDHHFATQRPTQNCAKRIQNEWRILEKDLPDTIFVRVYESRMDLLRAVIIGAEGTPYHDGLFFFDVCFPSTYPNTPPLVYYHSGGLRINPNLYNCGKVCLSLLNTWSGGKKEKWIPGKSTMLQVLVSIQGLILNTQPYFNEPGITGPNQVTSSLKYNENTFILSLKTMVYTMKNPPKNFEDLAVGHFRSRVLDILKACKAYTEGVQVGCLVKGGVQDVDEGKGRCSQKFKDGVASYTKTLIAAFKKIGANEAKENVHLSVKKAPLPAAPKVTRRRSGVGHSLAGVKSKYKHR